MSEDPDAPLRIDLETLVALLRQASQPERLRSEGGLPATVPRFYEASLFDPSGTGLAIRVMSVPLPVAAIANLRLGGNFEAPDLGPAGIFRVEPDKLPEAILATAPWMARPKGAVSRDLDLHPDVEGDYFDPHFDAQSRIDGARGAMRDDPRVAQFMYRVVVEELVPVESSPLNAKSLGELVQTGSPGIVLAYLAVDVDPLLAVFAPGFIVVLGASKGLARGFEEGLYRRVVKWMTGTDPGPDQAPPDPPADPPTPLA